MPEPRTRRQRIRRAPTGHRIGQDHHRAALTDEDVALIRELREQHHLTYQTLAEKFDSTRGTIRAICKYRRRVH